MNIAGIDIANGLKPYLIAEASCNHCGNLQTALTLIEMAKNSGADAIKFQAYTPDTITINSAEDDFIIKDGLWAGQTLYQLYRQTQTPFEWFPKLYEKSDEVGIPLFASVFDRSSIEMLERLGCPAYKIASMEITDTNLIRYAATTGKPVIISTGMASEDEIVKAMRAAIRGNFAVLACVSSYPASIKDPALARLRSLQEYCDISGLSDHTLGHDLAIAATGMNAAIIEKHLCLSRQDPTQDALFSMEPREFKIMAQAISAVHTSLIDAPAPEEAMQQFRRSIYAVKDIKKGFPLTEENIRSIRPGYGLPPRMMTSLLRRRAAVDIRKGTALTDGMTSR